MNALVGMFCDTILAFFEVTITVEQEKIAREIMYRVLLRKRHTIDISACRQIGKTEVVCFTLWFLSYVFPKIAGENLRAIITAPERTTGSEVFDRSKKLYDKCETQYNFVFVQKSLDVVLMPDGSRLDVFGLFKGFARREEKKTTKEGRSAHIIIRDEKHLGDDEIFRDELEPAMSTTGGVDIWVGNGGFRSCRAKELSEYAVPGHTMTVNGAITSFRLDYDYMRAAMLAEFARTKNPMFMRWIESQDKYIGDYGKESDEVQKNLYCKWIVEVGNFISWERLIQHRRTTLETRTNLADAGLDFAKGENGDETWATIVDYERNIRDWAIFSGEYPDQVEAMVAWFEQKQREHGISLRFIFCDTTGVGDPVKTMLKRRMRVPVRGVVFTVLHKDIMAKKLVGLGYTKVREFKPGIAGWKDSGGGVIK